MCLKVDIKGLPKERQEKVRKTRAGLKKGKLVISSRIIDDKTVDSLFQDLKI